MIALEKERDYGKCIVSCVVVSCHMQSNNNQNSSERIAYLPLGRPCDALPADTHTQSGDMIYISQEDCQAVWEQHSIDGGRDSIYMSCMCLGEFEREWVINKPWILWIKYRFNFCSKEKNTQIELIKRASVFWQQQKIKQQLFYYTNNIIQDKLAGIVVTILDKKAWSKKELRRPAYFSLVSNDNGDQREFLRPQWSLYPRMPHTRASDKLLTLPTCDVNIHNGELEGDLNVS